MCEAGRSSAGVPLHQKSGENADAQRLPLGRFMQYALTGHFRLEQFVAGEAVLHQPVPNSAPSVDIFGLGFDQRQRILPDLRQFFRMGLPIGVGDPLRVKLTGSAHLDYLAAKDHVVNSATHLVPVVVIARQVAIAYGPDEVR